MIDNSDCVVIGRFGRPHGIKGFLTVISFTEPRENILQYKDWHAFINRQWLPLKLLQLDVNNKSILALVEGYQQREEAARLTNVEIAVKRTQLPTLQQGEYYWYQLMGMQVITLEGHVLGNVSDMMSTGSNDVLVVVGEKRHLIPYLPGKSVIEISDSQGKITVDWDKDF